MKTNNETTDNESDLIRYKRMMTECRTMFEHLMDERFWNKPETQKALPDVVGYLMKVHQLGNAARFSLASKHPGLRDELAKVQDGFQDSTTKFITPYNPEHLEEGVARRCRAAVVAVSCEAVLSVLDNILAKIDEQDYKWIPKKDYTRTMGIGDTQFMRGVNDGKIITNKSPGDAKQKPCLVRVSIDFRIAD